MPHRNSSSSSGSNSTKQQAAAAAASVQQFTLPQPKPCCSGLHGPKKYATIFECWHVCCQKIVRILWPHCAAASALCFRLFIPHLLSFCLLLLLLSICCHPPPPHHSSPVVVFVLFLLLFCFAARRVFSLGLMIGNIDRRLAPKHSS